MMARLTYDDKADAAYLYLKEGTEPGEATTSVPVQLPSGVGLGSITLDFDDDGRLIGIEVLGASRLLPA
jgi:uncharacterized protein YuzE